MKIILKRKKKKWLMIKKYTVKEFGIPPPQKNFCSLPKQSTGDPPLEKNKYVIGFYLFTQKTLSFIRNTPIAIYL